LRRRTCLHCALRAAEHAADAGCQLNDLQPEQAKCYGV
jgi:hypothetical protein